MRRAGAFRGGEGGRGWAWGKNIRALSYDAKCEVQILPFLTPSPGGFFSRVDSHHFCNSAATTVLLEEAGLVAFADGPFPFFGKSAFLLGCPTNQEMAMASPPKCLTSSPPAKPQVFANLGQPVLFPLSMTPEVPFTFVNPLFFQPPHSSRPLNLGLSKLFAHC